MNAKVGFGIGVVLIAVAIGMWTASYLKRGDGIESNKAYALAYTYKATIKGGGEARVFDFADRSLPRTSVVVPVRDLRGMALVRENPNLPPSTVRKVVGYVPTSVMEGVTYPGYDYTLWEYHLSVRSEQSVVPTVTPSK